MMKKRLILVLLASLALPFASWATLPKTIPTYTEQKTSFLVTPDQPEFTIKLKSNPTTGYSWFLREYNPNYLEPVKHHYQSSENHKMMGTPGYELWTFKVKALTFTVPRQIPLRFVYARPWENSEETISMVFWVSTIGRK